MHMMDITSKNANHVLTVVEINNLNWKKYGK